MLVTLEQIETLIAQDNLRLQLLLQVKELNLPDWYIAAGVVRNYVWDVIFDCQYSAHFRDIDVIYFSQKDTRAETDLAYQHCLQRINPNVKWSVKNQARMHLRNGDTPYQSSLHAMRHWPEIQTAIGATLDDNLEVKASSPFATQLQMDCISRNSFKDNLDIFEQRLLRHQWLERWPKLRIKY